MGFELVSELVSLLGCLLVCWSELALELLNLPRPQLSKPQQGSDYGVLLAMICEAQLFSSRDLNDWR